MNIEDKFRKVSINSGAGSRWGPNGIGREKAEKNGCLISETRASLINNSSREQIVCKAAGSGWGGTGGGKPITRDSNSKAQNATAGRISGKEGDIYHDPAGSSSKEWKKVLVGSSSRSGNVSRELRTPEWSHPLIRPLDRIQPGNGSFWPSRNNAWGKSDSRPYGSYDKGRGRRSEDSEDCIAHNWQHNSSKANGGGQSAHRG